MAAPEASQAAAHAGYHRPQVVGGPCRHNRHAQAQAQGDGDDEAVAPVQGAQGDDLDAGHAHRGEQERCETPENTLWDGGEEAGHLQSRADMGAVTGSSWQSILMETAAVVCRCLDLDRAACSRFPHCGGCSLVEEFRISLLGKAWRSLHLV